MVSYKKYGYDQLREFDDPSLCSLFPIPKPDTFPVVKRMFELALEGNSSNSIKSKLSEEYPHIKPLCKSAVDKKLQDRFYSGQWIICKGTDKERMVDLNSLSAPD